jgi:3,4-dehydroadipyl-CoA semialdehyde dehydrogenase
VQLSNFIEGQWRAGAGTGQGLFDPVLGTELARASSDGIDLAAALNYSRRVGGPALRALGYAERAQLLTRIADVLTANRPSYLKIALENSGSPESDAAIDIDGSIYTLKYYARAAASLGTAHYLQEGDAQSLSKDGAFQTSHLLLPLRGVAIFINAFNFPAWGLWEKAAPALLSGMPLMAKPATSTALLTWQMVQDVVRAGVLPEGALSLICGGARDLLDHVSFDDVVAFTGSAATASRLRGTPAIVRQSTRLNVEADSLNLALLGPDAAAGSEEFDLFVREVVREMTVKAGQKCTAIRRILVPAALQASVAEAIAARLVKIAVGNPRNADVRMGPLVSKAQQQSVLDGLAQLRSQAQLVTPDPAQFRPIDADPAVAAFVPPTLLQVANAREASLAHEVEVFGPVATLMSYANERDAFALARLGLGSLVASVFSADDEFTQRAVLELAGSHGRVLAVHSAVGKLQTGHGNAMPMCLHGGPGRAGGGEELGGLRALNLYHRRCAVQAGAGRIASLRTQAAGVTV